MNVLLFLITLNLILVSRFGLTFKDEGTSAATILKMAALPLLSLLFIQVNFAWFILLAYLLLYPLLMIAMERSAVNIYRNRLAGLIIHILVLGVIFSPLLNAQVYEFLMGLLIGNEDDLVDQLLQLQILLFGGLLVMNEMNIVLRYSLRLLQLDPLGRAGETISDQQYNTGRVIGMLERIFIYVFAIAGQFAAIGFILTAKGVVRYKEFENNKTFAEYVLIGTLLSALLALLIALLVGSLI
ncbi:hypothetical protein BH23BAC3_BH23BAC3_04610 [soil metagenome]